jgi:hypothetical protein
VAHRTLSDVHPRLKTSTNWPLSSFLRAIPLKFIELFGAPPDCPVSQRNNDQLRQRSTAERSDRQKSEYSLRCQIAPDCPVPQEDRRLQRSTAPNPNGRLTWHALTVNNVVSGAPPDCPVCPLTATAGIVVGAINTPNHHHSSHPSIPTSSFNTRAKE